MTTEAEAGEAGAGTEGAAAAGAAGGEGGASPEWMASLSEDLRGDATLQRYKTLDELARGHVEARKVASSRVLIPGADADEATRNAYFEQIGRPKDPAGYEFKLPEGTDPKAVDGFREFAFKTGMPKEMAEAVVEFDNARVAAAADAWHANAKTELDAWKAETPDHEAQLGHIKSMLAKFGVDDAIANDIEVRLGTATMMKLFSNIAKATTEHKRVDGDAAKAIGGAVEGAQARLSEKLKDEGFRKRLNANEGEAKREYSELVSLAAQEAQLTDEKRFKKDD